MQTAGLGLCRNRHGNQFHTRIHIPKDLIRLVGRAEMRVSLGTEARRYAISSARAIHARKITAFDELRALMSSRKTDPTPEQQEEARKRLLEHMRGQLARQALKYPPEYDSQGDAQEADRERELNVQIAALDALAENVLSTEFAHARRFHEIVGSADPGMEAFKLTTAQVSDAAEIVQLRTDLVRIESESRAREFELEKTRELLQDAVRSGVPQVAELSEVRMSELLAAYRDAPEFQKKGERTNTQYVAEVERFYHAAFSAPCGYDGHYQDDRLRPLLVHLIVTPADGRS
ncbi:DUF6538 domain-containing protein [Diaphorobacter caeni]|uniref:DUF6538 domain-containing protein n=1 Tax=Diaphorobacter caeni TaxID=2784387 RepID=UPI00188E329F|nr:DUF6538 domain-containing protein [Diaphorobacter caeni]MBF5007960.1 hypothetical protein [Diaphorobacter caeni]